MDSRAPAVASDRHGGPRSRRGLAEGSTDIAREDAMNLHLGADRRTYKAHSRLGGLRCGYSLERELWQKLRIGQLPGRW